MTPNFKYIITTSALASLAACSPAPADTSPASLGAFTASGSEPFWSATWDETRLSFDIGIEKSRTTFENPALVKTPNGWQMTSDGLSLTLDTTGCQNMAGETRSYEITALVNDVKLVGCGDPQ